MIILIGALGHSYFDGAEKAADEESCRTDGGAVPCFFQES